MATGGVSVADWKHVITPAQLDAAGKEIAAEVAIKYGMFFQTVIDFLLIALVIFLFLKGYNRMRKPAEAPATAEEVLLLREIRDSLKR
jgi:large conductance mechanosensitive channel